MCYFSQKDMDTTTHELNIIWSKTPKLLFVKALLSRLHGMLLSSEREEKNSLHCGLSVIFPKP